MDPVEARKVILTAIAADDYLMEEMVLKGGNALELIHRVGSRASMDLDFSIAADFEDPTAVASKLCQSLEDRFDAAGYLVFDFAFSSRPSGRPTGALWGGYTASFKVIQRTKADKLSFEIDHMRRQADPVGPDHRRIFRIEISPFEYTVGRVEAEVEHYTCYVYSLDMIAAEKLRAICQQSPEYPRRAHSTPRARDFYDIHAVVTEGGVNLGDQHLRELVLAMFRVKEVDLRLIAKIENQREFHRQDWPSVQVAVAKTLKDFDYYFDFVVEEVRVLEPLWVEDPPL